MIALVPNALFHVVNIVICNSIYLQVDLVDIIRAIDLHWTLVARPDTLCSFIGSRVARRVSVLIL